MKIKLLNKLRGLVLAILSLFSKKKRNRVVLSLNTTVATTEPVPMEQIKLHSKPATGIIDITQMLDQECSELYGRNPYIRY